MDNRVIDLRNNKRLKTIKVIYKSKSLFSKISHLFSMDGYKLDIESMSSNKESGCELTFTLKNKNSNFDSFIANLLNDDNCISIYIFNIAKEGIF